MEGETKGGGGGGGGVDIGRIKAVVGRLGWGRIYLYVYFRILFSFSFSAVQLWYAVL